LYPSDSGNKSKGLRSSSKNSYVLSEMIVSGVDMRKIGVKI